MQTIVLIISLYLIISLNYDNTMEREWAISIRHEFTDYLVGFALHYLNATITVTTQDILFENIYTIYVISKYYLISIYNN